MDQLLKLDLGCGPNKEPGFIGIDLENFPGVDIVRDLRRGIPFNDNAVEIIKAYHILEHFCGVDLIFLIEELYRVSIDMAIWIVKTPDADVSPNSYKDPLHVSFWHADSWDFWSIDKNGNHCIFVSPFYHRQAKLKLENTKIDSNKDRTYTLSVIKRGKP